MDDSEQFRLELGEVGVDIRFGLGSYQTAWTMLHWFRRTMASPERDKQHGLVEVDETYLAITDRQSPTTAKGRKSNTTKVVVVMAVEIHEPKDFRRIRLQRVRDDSAASVIPFVQDVVDSRGDRAHGRVCGLSGG